MTSVSKYLTDVRISGFLSNSRNAIDLIALV